MRKYFFLVLLLYAFGVALRVVGQLMNKQPIEWKPTLFLGEFGVQKDGYFWSTLTYDKLWKARVVTMLALPLVWLWLLKNKLLKF